MKCFKITNNNRRCSRECKNGYCWQHTPKILVSEDELEQTIEKIELVSKIDKYYLEVIKPYN